MRVICVDDVPEDIQKMKEYLNTFGQSQKLTFDLDTFSSSEDFLKNFEPNKYSIILLDIFLDGINGIDIAKRIRTMDEKALLFFTTTSPDFAIDGYSVMASDYLLKPFTYEQFETALLPHLPALEKDKHYIRVKEKRYQVNVLLDDIIYTDYNNHYIQIHTKERMIRSYMPFCAFEPLLIAYPQFLCCYRNVIVNMDHVLSLDQTDFIMTTGERVPLRRPEKMELRQRYADYIFQKMNGGVGI